MDQVMKIDSDAVGEQANRIALLVTDLEDENSKFIKVVEEQIQKTDNRYKPFLTIQDTMQKQAAKLKTLAETQETIRKTLDAYAEMMAEADDDSEFRVD